MKHFAEDISVELKPSEPKKFESPESKHGRKSVVLLAAGALVLLGIIMLAIWLVYKAGNAHQPTSEDIFAAGILGDDDSSIIAQEPEPSEEEKRLAEAVKAGGDPADPDIRYLPTPLVAVRSTATTTDTTTTDSSIGAPPTPSPAAPNPTTTTYTGHQPEATANLLIHSPILPRDITEIEFHQASYDTSLVHSAV